MAPGTSVDLLVLTVVGLLLYTFANRYGEFSKPPCVNPSKVWDFRKSRQKLEFVRNSKGLLHKGQEAFKGRPFRVKSERGDVTVLPYDMAHGIRNEHSLSFDLAVYDDFHAYIPGFEPVLAATNGQQPVRSVAMRQLTLVLSKLTEPLSSETAFAVKHILADDSVHWFLPSVQKLRAQIQDANNIIVPLVHRRRAMRAEAIASGQPEPRFNDAIDWFEEFFDGKPYDPVGLQINLSVGAIHTTTDLLYWTMICIADHPEYFNLLREEIIRVLSSEGWKKTSLYNLKLLDSVIKESQRLKPTSIANMRRVAEKNIDLPNGVHIRKGEKIVVSLTDLFEKPHEFDGHRWIKMRDIPGKEHSAHLVAVSRDHIGFGLGEHACPGRFFAANELKIVLCHLLLKFDWEFVPDARPKVLANGFSLTLDPKADLRMRRRTAELDLEGLAVD
ncbi:hypothetical protein diail_3570 [Diaporthe ilicicola]|nr:hypothetical protein diail_3570 [Diaporthe ilicicola]